MINSQTINYSITSCSLVAVPKKIWGPHQRNAKTEDHQILMENEWRPWKSPFSLIALKTHEGLAAADALMVGRYPLQELGPKTRVASGETEGRHPRPSFLSSSHPQPRLGPAATLESVPRAPRVGANSPSEGKPIWPKVFTTISVHLSTRYAAAQRQR